MVFNKERVPSSSQQSSVGSWQLQDGWIDYFAHPFIQNASYVTSCASVGHRKLKNIIPWPFKITIRITNSPNTIAFTLEPTETSSHINIIFPGISDAQTTISRNMDGTRIQQYVNSNYVNRHSLLESSTARAFGLRNSLSSLVLHCYKLSLHFYQFSLYLFLALLKHFTARRSLWRHIKPPITFTLTTASSPVRRRLSLRTDLRSSHSRFTVNLHKSSSWRGLWPPRANTHHRGLFWAQTQIWATKPYIILGPTALPNFEY